MEGKGNGIDLGSIGDVKIVEDEKEYMIKEVNSLKTMGALITKEADSMSAMRFRMNKADEAFWMDMKFYKNRGIAEGRKHKRYSEIVQYCLLPSCEMLRTGIWIS